MKSSLAKIFIVLFLIIEASCGGDIPDCPSKLCVLAGGWKLVEVYIDGVKDTSTDLSKYKLTLFMPNPTTAVTSDFDRVNPSGRQDTGTWELRNNSTILALLPNSSPDEPYIIKSFSPRQLILVINRDDNKTGPSEYEYVLEPF
jgi:Lipocalin-like domain